MPSTAHHATTTALSACLVVWSVVAGFPCGPLPARPVAGSAGLGAQDLLDLELSGWAAARYFDRNMDIAQEEAAIISTYPREHSLHTILTRPDACIKRSREGMEFLGVPLNVEDAVCGAAGLRQVFKDIRSRIADPPQGLSGRARAPL